MTEHIAFYSKGGAGVSTLVSNISAALVEAGFRIVQIGCGPDGESCSNLNSGRQVQTLWQEHAERGHYSFDTVVTRGFKDVYCIELGSPLGEFDVAWTEQAVEILKADNLIASLCPDYVLFDISGHQTAHFLQTVRQRLGLDRIFAVTTADFMALKAVNSVLNRLDDADTGQVPVPFGGVIPNVITNSFEESFVADFARAAGISVLGRIPRSEIVRQCELYGKTVIEASPLSNQSYFYRRLANQVVDDLLVHAQKPLPQPLPPESLRGWAQDWANRLYALDNGLVSDGAAI